MKVVARLAFVGLVIWCAKQSPAQTVPSDTELIRQLAQQIHELQARVQELEAGAVKAPVTAAISVPEPIIPSEPAMDSMPADHSQHSMSTPSVNLRGYADLGYFARNSAGGNSTFALGQADLFLTSKLSNRLSFLMETAIDSDANNVAGIEIERMFLTYRHNDYFNVDVGRYHTSIGYFNGAFHHGRWFQTATSRPYLFWFEDQGGILPIHNVGVSVSGKVPSGSLGLHYGVEIGNGRAYKTPDAVPVQVVKDENNGKAINVALYARPSAMPGWQFGVSAYRDHLTPDDQPAIRQMIYSAHAVYVMGRTEFINEGIVMRHSTSAAGGPRITHVPGFYSQASYRFGAAWRPYFRFEYMNPALSDPVAGPFLSEAAGRRSIIGGLRYDLTEFCALKFQAERTSRQNLPAALETGLQLAFAF